ncbi:MAG: alpha/beta fold hydrolase [Gemmatimonadota bacterium]
MRTVTALLAASLLLPVSAGAQAAPHPTYVIVHGAWGGAWDWKTVDSMLTARGSRVYRPELTGLGERVHLASPSITLDTHITDVVNAIVWEDLHDVILVGHSYGGMVITGVADRIPERIRRVVYVDAFLPESGESAMDLAQTAGLALQPMLRDGFLVPPWVGPDAAIPHDVPQPAKTFTDTLRLTNSKARSVPGSYILTFEPGKEPDAFQPFADRARARGWPVARLEADHNAQRSARAGLVKLLLEAR